MNKQEEKWAGCFGDQYTQRCNPSVRGRRPFFHKLLAAKKIESICEVGANRGNNLLALSSIFPKATLSAVEINAMACLQIPNFVHVFCGKFLEFNPEINYDLVLTCGFLIHVHPDDLQITYDKLFTLAKKYLLICEYFQPKPTTIVYRGENELLFVRDFAQEIKQHLPVTLLDYGFLWKEENPDWDNIHWWLFEKDNE